MGFASTGAYGNTGTLLAYLFVRENSLISASSTYTLTCGTCQVVMSTNPQNVQWSFVCMITQIVTHVPGTVPLVALSEDEV